MIVIVCDFECFDDMLPCGIYDGLEGSAGLVDLGGRGNGAEGLMAHFGLAVTPLGRSLGVFSLDADLRRDAP